MNTFASLVVCSAVAACSGSGRRDAVAPSRDVVSRGESPQGAQRTAEGYEYVARRPLVVVGLAEARGLDAQLARAAVDWLADEAGACLVREQQRGTTLDGAVRVAAEIASDGRVARTGVRLDPGAGLAQTTVLCLVTPARLMTFPATTAEGGARGIAVEAVLGESAMRGVH